MGKMLVTPDQDTLSQNGYGAFFCFSADRPPIPLVNGTDETVQAIQHLILVPTRELALQYVQELDDVAKFTDVVCFAVFGGFFAGFLSKLVSLEFSETI